MGRGGVQGRRRAQRRQGGVRTRRRRDVRVPAAVPGGGFRGLARGDVHAGGKDGSTRGCRGDTRRGLCAADGAGQGVQPARGTRGGLLGDTGGPAGRRASGRIGVSE